MSALLEWIFRNILKKALQKYHLNNIYSQMGKSRLVTLHLAMGGVIFYGATFGDGDAIFFSADFGRGYVSFRDATFGDGNVSFSHANFGDGTVSFIHTNFGNGDVWFNDVTFGDVAVSFSHANFGDGNVTFSHATFGEGDVSFNDATFGDGRLFFNVKAYGVGALSFEHITCTSISFESTEEASSVRNLTDFSLRGATIDGPLILNNLKFNCIPDLRSTKLSHHVDMDGLDVNLVRERGNWRTCWHRHATDKTAQSKLGRLKEIAEQFKHHHEALKFNAMENQAKRWVNEPSFIKNVMDMLYFRLSDYGRSYVWPMVGLAFSWLYFAISYTLIAFIASGKLPNLLHMLGFTVVNSLPFIPIGRSIRTKAEALYFSGSVDWVYGVITVQSVVSLILIFLIGLGLRNQFRL
ncbi:pentapeptide repeat-containing protein [Alteromonas gilva]|uniref:Pentapeptide repeat-containing protein n=1 Tax=Alteromonas gilva TaxID=2987522 RepID=A0ABT5L731_9ALTE|nr:pentapeptide repeat-containing protein [Alteromonas gilva]MDC8832878.1 pentapeptide repeat-containing protein [Alteromonas gilva]